MQPTRKNMKLKRKSWRNFSIPSSQSLIRVLEVPEECLEEETSPELTLVDRNPEVGKLLDQLLKKLFKLLVFYTCPPVL